MTTIDKDLARLAQIRSTDQPVPGIGTVTLTEAEYLDLVRMAEDGLTARDDLAARDLAVKALDEDVATLRRQVDAVTALCDSWGGPPEVQPLREAVRAALATGAES